MKLTIMLWNTQQDEATHRKIHIASNILKEDVIEGCVYLCVCVHARVYLSVLVFSFV